ncbi:putative Quaternary ammonium compound-resistance protein QacF [Arthrobacter sp. 9V]|uniref:DMT family transporter n=1 Tax=Micrococcaceae TaxID=1268 RepID=UPI0012F1DA10|nr:SMR family transporter [Arthrobacter sp. 9V]VXB53128.1 putative Quaternary ammonium compound-resistance protein QacF [Arthrobacter sp. 9V]
MTWMFLGLAILTELAATMGLRASEGLRKKLWLVVILPGYALAFVFLGLALKEGLALGLGYGVWVACGVALTAVFARILFKDPLNWLMASGILLIAAGVVILQLGATAAILT